MHPERRPNPDRSADALADRLRALPPPPVPAELEARLLAAIPARRPAPRRWAVWVGAAGALAAACLLALLWLRGAGPGPRDEPVPPNPAISRAPDDRAGLATWLASRRVPDETAPPAFTWPLEETSTLRVVTAIPPDLLD